jgi:fumarate hydratase, class I
MEYPELGMEAVWKVEVADFPAFVVMPDFFAETAASTLHVSFSW